MLILSLNTPPQAQLEVPHVLLDHSPVPLGFTPRTRSSTCSIPRASTLPVGLFAHMALLNSLAVAVLTLLLLPSLPLGPWLIQRIRIKHPNRLGFLQSVFTLIRVGYLQLFFGLFALDGFISPMFGCLRLFLPAAPLISAFELFSGSGLGFFSRSEIEFIIRLVFAVIRNFSPPRLVIQDIPDISPPQVRHVEVTQPKCTRELLQLVKMSACCRSVETYRSSTSPERTRARTK